MAHKGLHTLLAAFAELAGSMPDQPLELRLAGETICRRTRSELAAQAAALGMSERVRFLGRVPAERLPELYRSAALCVQPSTSESFGNPLVEAMASGTPIVVSDMPSARELCAGAARLCPPGAPDALAAAMGEVLRDPGIASGLSEKGLARAKHFTWGRAADELLGVLRGVHQRGRGDPSRG